jgi:uncharacterized glyoxalase superfamily protein PhnB
MPNVAYAKVRAAGAKVVEDTETRPSGLRTFTVKDPDGSLIGISHEVHDPRDHPHGRDLSHESVTA